MHTRNIPMPMAQKMWVQDARIDMSPRMIASGVKARFSAEFRTLYANTENRTIKKRASSYMRTSIIFANDDVRREAHTRTVRHTSLPNVFLTRVRSAMTMRTYGMKADMWKTNGV